jgi:Fic family protein
MIEKTPKFEVTKETFNLLLDNELKPLFNKINTEYLYWDKVKYLAPKGIGPEELWTAVKIIRNSNMKRVQLSNFTFSFMITEQMQKTLHEFDMNLGGNLGTLNIVPEKDYTFYLVSSIMEEAIASSQMEGATTTRKVAKDMLRKGRKPSNKSQQMIFNNYQTIDYIINNKDKDFTLENLLEIHKRISSQTMDDVEEEGSFRKSDDIYVMNEITGEVAHIPPSHKDVVTLLKNMCEFANNETQEGFIHPIIKSIILHFMLAYIHPFSDGNGRTARSIVYWYLIKQGYWLMQYLSISRIIYKSKPAYEKSFLYTENDELDLTYFIQYNLKAMNDAFKELKKYLQRKINDAESMHILYNIKDVNERQAKILKILKDLPMSIFTATEISTRFGVDIKTARKDLQCLVALGYMETRKMAGSKSIGYLRSNNFEDRIREGKGIKGK